MGARACPSDFVRTVVSQKCLRQTQSSRSTAQRCGVIGADEEKSVSCVSVFAEGIGFCGDNSMPSRVSVRDGFDVLI